MIASGDSAVRNGHVCILQTKPIYLHDIPICSQALATIGLFLFVATTVIAVNSLNNIATISLSRIDTWMFLAGLISSALIIAAGLIYLMYAGRAEDRKRLGAIVQKLLNETR